MHLRKNLKYLRERAKLSQAALADALGKGQTTIQKIETGETKDPKFKDEIARFFNIPEHDLVYKDLSSEQTQNNEFKQSGKLAPYDNVNELIGTNDIVMVKFASNLSAACGDGIVNDQHVDGKSFPFYFNSLKKAGVKDVDKVIVGYADGESNSPSIPDGAAIGIDTGCTKIINKEIYLITVEGEERLKQIVNLGEGRYLMRSLNPNKELFPDQIMDTETMAEKQILIRGRLFWCSWLNPA